MAPTNSNGALRPALVGERLVRFVVPGAGASSVRLPPWGSLRPARCIDRRDRGRNHQRRRGDAGRVAAGSAVRACLPNTRIVYCAGGQSNGDRLHPDPFCRRLGRSPFRGISRWARRDRCTPYYRGDLEPNCTSVVYVSRVLWKMNRPQPPTCWRARSRNVRIPRTSCPQALHAWRHS